MCGTILPQRWRKKEEGSKVLRFGARETLFNDFGGEIMTKNNFLLFMFIIVVGIFGLRIMEAQLSHGPLPVPVAGMTYSVQELLNLINQNNPQKNSDFLVPLTGPRTHYTVMNAAMCGANNGAGIGQITGSGGANVRGVSYDLSAHVTLYQDLSLITYLATMKDPVTGESKPKLNAVTKTLYAKILLYFELGGYRFYLNDPYPAGPIGAIMIKKGPLVRNPVQNIISKWNLKQSYYPGGVVK